jgi:hypothetical protein
MKSIVASSITAVALGILIAAASGCQKTEGPMERTGREIDKAAEKTGQQIDKSIHKTGEKLEEAGEKMKDSVK